MKVNKRIIMKRVLVVDDQPQIVKLVETFLTQKGFSVKTAISGKEALEICNSWRPQIILLDIIMPEMDGFETLLKIQEWNVNVSVIMVTSLDDLESGKKALQLGAVDYITKPLDFDYLEQTLIAKFNALFSDIE